MRIYSYGLAEMHEAHIRLRFSIDDSAPQFFGETIGISPRHLIITTPTELEEGMRLGIKIPIATDLSAGATSDLELFGWVISRSALSHGQFAYQVELEHD